MPAVPNVIGQKTKSDSKHASSELSPSSASDYRAKSGPFKSLMQYEQSELDGDEDEHEEDLAIQEIVEEDSALNEEDKLLQRMILKNFMGR